MDGYSGTLHFEAAVILQDKSERDREMRFFCARRVARNWFSRSPDDTIEWAVGLEGEEREAVLMKLEERTSIYFGDSEKAKAFFQRLE